LRFKIVSLFWAKQFNNQSQNYKHTNGNIYNDPYGYDDPDGNKHRDGYDDCDANADGYSKPNVDGYVDQYGYPHKYSNGDSHRH
jgi:hypothetical protein